MSFRPIRVNKSLLPEDLESLHDRRWKVNYRREETVTWPDDQDYVVEEVRQVEWSVDSTVDRSEDRPAGRSKDEHGDKSENWSMSRIADKPMGRSEDRPVAKQ